LHRLKPHVAVGPLAAALAVLPVLGAAVLAADPVVVQPGDTLTAISARSGVPIERIVTLNELADPDRIFVGQRLRLEPAAPEAEAPIAGGSSHVVRRGESLWGIARHYGSSVAAIAAANGLDDPSRILAGQRLVIPGTSAAASAAPVSAAPQPEAVVTHVVRRGESLWGIARRTGSSVAAISAANGLDDPSRIFPGQRLVIPGAGGASTEPAAPSLPADLAAVVAARDEVRRLIVAEAEAQGVPAELALAVAWQESGWRQGVVSHAGAIGIMQLLPTTADWVATSMLGSAVDVHDPQDNVRAGIRLLRHYLDRYGADSDLVLAAYYQGQAAADRHGIYGITRPYIASIRTLERMFGG
jgi:LysM repeat protein